MVTYLVAWHVDVQVLRRITWPCEDNPAINALWIQWDVNGRSTGVTNNHVLCVVIIELLLDLDGYSGLHLQATKGKSTIISSLGSLLSFIANGVCNSSTIKSITWGGIGHLDTCWTAWVGFTVLVLSFSRFSWAGKSTISRSNAVPGPWFDTSCSTAAFLREFLNGLCSIFFSVWNQLTFQHMMTIDPTLPSKLEHHMKHFRS